MEYKYSIFGDFNSIHSDIGSVNAKFGSNYKREMSNSLVQIANQTSRVVVPIYSFVEQEKNEVVTISPSRIDFVFQKNEMYSEFKRYYCLIKDILPDYLNRLAINITGSKKDTSLLLLKKVSEKTGLLLNDFDTSELYLRKNQTKVINKELINNIISVQNGKIKASDEFVLVPGIVYSIDLNTAIRIGTPPLINKNEALAFFEKLEDVVTDDLKIIDEFLE